VKGRVLEVVANAIIFNNSKKNHPTWVGKLSLCPASTVLIVWPYFLPCIYIESQPHTTCSQMFFILGLYS